MIALSLKSKMLVVKHSISSPVFISIRKSIHCAKREVRVVETARTVSSLEEVKR
jgi:hypothetical protein